MELEAVAILSVGPAMRGSATLMQFRGAGHKLALTAVQRFKEWPQAVSYRGNCSNHGLTDGFAFEVMQALCLLPITKLPPKACIGIGVDRDFCAVIGCSVELTGSGNDSGWVAVDA